jgi:hypothetical protein
VIRKLPLWDDTSRSTKDQAASPLETFIYEFEPAGDDAAEFRSELAALLNHQHGDNPFLRQFLLKWSPEDLSDSDDFQMRMAGAIEWQKAFVSGCPDVAWEP